MIILDSDIRKAQADRSAQISKVYAERRRALRSAQRGFLLNPYRYAGPASSRILMLHGNGANGSTTFLDSSLSARSITAIGNAQLSTAQVKYGSASMLFDGSSDYLTVSGFSDFAFGTGDFCIQAWCRISTTKSDQLIFSTSTDGSANGGYWISLAGTAFNMYRPGSTLVFSAAGVVSGDSTWHHWAVARSGTSLKAFKDGITVATATLSAGLIASEARVGGTPNFGGFNPWFNGYIDDLAIDNAAIYTADFTPPGVELSDS